MNSEILTFFNLTGDIYYLLEYTKQNTEKINKLRRIYTKEFNNDFINTASINYKENTNIIKYLATISDELNLDESNSCAIFAYIIAIKRTEYKYAKLTEQYIDDIIKSLYKNLLVLIDNYKQTLETV